MSKFTYKSWSDFVLQLKESHDKYNASTSNPIWLVQENKRTAGMNSDYSDDSVWVVDSETSYKTASELFEDLEASDRHEINAYCLNNYDLLFTDLDGDERGQNELLAEYIEGEGTSKSDWERVYYVESWETVEVFITRQDADQYIAKRSHNHRGELRVYVDSLWRSPQLRELMQAILDGELKLVKGGDAL